MVSLSFSRFQVVTYFKENALQICLVLTVAFLLYKIIKQITSHKLPPGPIGLPVVGYALFLGRNIHETFHKLSEKYGNIVSLKIGQKLSIVLNDYEIMKETLCHPMALDKDSTLLNRISDTGFAAKNGVEWEEQRRFSMQSMRDLGIGRGAWQKLIQDEIPGFLEELRSFEGKPAVIDELLAYTVGGNILSLLIGRRLEKGKDDEYIQLTHDYSDAIIQTVQGLALADIIPGLSSLQLLTGIGERSNTMNTAKKFSIATRNEIRKHQTNEESANVTDFISIYLDKLKSMTKSTEKHYFSETNAEGNINVLFLGGSDTILASLGWLFRLMAAHPEIQKKVQVELDDIIGIDGTISYEDRSKIPYTFAVLSENQRFASIVPVSPAREATEDFEIRGYTIPKGASIMTNLDDIHHDPKYWKQPGEFKPERFLSEDGTKLIQKLPSFVPFSIGRRNCPGETVAWMEILTFFTAVMQKFTISFPPGVKPIFEYHTGIVKHLKPQKMCFVERNV